MNLQLVARIQAFLHPEKQFEAIASDWGSYAVQKFKAGNVRGCFNHIKSEVEELELEMDLLEAQRGFSKYACSLPQHNVLPYYGPERDKLAFEIADIIIVAFHLAWKLGIYNIGDYVTKKILKNKGRTWGAPDPHTGIIHHTNVES